MIVSMSLKDSTLNNGIAFSCQLSAKSDEAGFIYVSFIARVTHFLRLYETRFFAPAWVDLFFRRYK